jgi:acyl carrier protein
MSSGDLAKDIEQFVKRNYLLDDAETIDHTQSLIGSGIIDSTGILELITFLEERYGIQFEDSELTAENFESIGRIAAFLGEKSASLANRGGA